MGKTPHMARKADVLFFCIMKAHNVSRAGASATRTLQCKTNPCQSILVVEDEPDIRQLDTEVLRESGYQVDIAENGLVALHSVKTDRYDLLVIEDEMLIVTGQELVKKLRSEGILVPVILVLGTMPTLESSRNLWPQIQAILIKPYTVAELIKTVREVLLSACNDTYVQFAPPSNWQNPGLGSWFEDLRIHR
jgi:DNA-binding response OmpR family regulator